MMLWDATAVNSRTWSERTASYNACYCFLLCTHKKTILSWSAGCLSVLKCPCNNAIGLSCTKINFEPSRISFAQRYPSTYAHHCHCVEEIDVHNHNQHICPHIVNQKRQQRILPQAPLPGVHHSCTIGGKGGGRLGHYFHGSDVLVLFGPSPGNHQWHFIC